MTLAPFRAHLHDHRDDDLDLTYRASKWGGSVREVIHETCGRPMFTICHTEQGFAICGAWDPHPMNDRRWETRRDLGAHLLRGHLLWSCPLTPRRPARRNET
jgi:hypothetical protein